VAKTETGEILH